MKTERVRAILSSQVENTASNSEFWPRLGPISPLKNATCDITMTQEVVLGLIGIKKKKRATYDTNSHNYGPQNELTPKSRYIGKRTERVKVEEPARTRFC